ncbi:MAG: type II secretion system protein N [Tepidimonas sp.]|uniref:type II secretion system protein N n=1 Tax=Tepidimonas sp. TaxID=2002775 RepID=UPI00298F1380|nr:type II secretion system protein N [Tepidimonas sp.]MDW8336527.1 type II secretion system protein N [Tepidimonas sp.]
MSRRPTVRWAVAGALLAISAASVVHAPARWLDMLLQRASSDRVRLLQPHGSLWAGSGVLRIQGQGAALDLPGRLQWTLAADPTLPGLRLELRPDCCTKHPWLLTLRWREGSFWLEGQPWQAWLDLAWLQALGAPWNTIGLQGQAQLQIQGLHWRLGDVAAAHTPRANQLQAQLDLRDVGAAVSPLRPLGHYRLTFSHSSSQAGPTFTLTTLTGDLQLHAEGGWPDGRLTLRGLAEANPERLDALSNLLNLLGRRDGLRAHLRIGNPA